MVKEGFARRWLVFFFFSLRLLFFFFRKPDTQWDGSNRPSLFPLSYYRYYRIYLGLKFSNGKTGVFGFCMKDRSLPGDKGGVCITITVTGWVVSGIGWIGLGWITHYQRFLTASTKLLLLCSGWNRMGWNGNRNMEYTASYLGRGVFNWEWFFGYKFSGGAYKNNKTRQTRYLPFITLSYLKQLFNTNRATCRDMPQRMPLLALWITTIFLQLSD